MTNLLRHRVFILAIAVSLLWHVFWLSAVRIVTAPQARGAVKFSKVSFLGPFLARGAISLRVQPREKVFLEKRYRNTAGNYMEKTVLQEKAVPHKYESDVGKAALTDRKLMDLIEEALGGAKEKPDYSE